MKILIAQADEASREMLIGTLAKWEHEVIVAPDGARAWQELHGQSLPKLAILDRTMPGMDGLQICRELRRRTDQAYIYVLLTLTREEASGIVEAVTAGADDCLVKPLTEDELMIRLRIA
jgi:DNA-binding response OmpR family regulator